MPCLHSDALESTEPGSAPPSCRGDRGVPPQGHRGRAADGEGDGLVLLPAVEPPLQDAQEAEMSPLLPRVPRSTSDHSDLRVTAHHRRMSSPLSSSRLTISSLADRPRTHASNLSAPEWMDRSSPDVLGHSPCSPHSHRSSRFSFPPCHPLSPICPCSPDLSLLHSPLPLRPSVTKSVTCGQGEFCPWMMELLRGGLSWMASVTELCQGAVLHTGDLVEAEGSFLSLVKKDSAGKKTLEEVIAPTAMGCLSECTLYCNAQLELVKGIMGCVMATGSPMNLRDISEDPRFEVYDDQASKIKTVLSIPIRNHRGEVVGVVLMVNKRNNCDGSLSVFTNMDEKVLANHMDVLGMILDNVQLYESSRQEAKRSQALTEMAQELSKGHYSFEVLLSKMAATIMPFTHAQYCTIFIPSKYDSDKTSFSRVIHLECEELGSTCQIYRRERDIREIDPSFALRTLVAMEMLNMSASSEESIKSLICCPVRNEKSEDVIAVCQLMNKQSRDSDETEAFNRYDECLLEDLAMYCGLALQYAQAVQITEERRASIEVTQEVLAYHITAAEQEIQALQEATIPSAESLHILDFHFSDFGLPEDQTTQATIRMFLDLNLVQDFNIDYKGSQILSGLSAGDHRAVLQMIKRAILATDLTVYIERRKEFFSLSKKSKVSWRSEKQRDLLRSMLMTASDLSAITKPWPEQKRIANLVAMEFFAQGDKEKEEFKIKPIDIMNRENSTRLPYMQVEYIDEICYPLYKAVSRLFDPCVPLLSGCKKNRENWLHLAEEAEEENSENSTSITLDAHKSNEEETQTEEQRTEDEKE
ncbi:hypothetical protein L3Q82_005393 [Scortum barcoo]|uniref:Uncharacterized protein n=1 Tax=Scortum barcoo TaxID=214431 RepID=A0ACB8VAA9_9TELE|nr:hypothetical protein L3Q82_005393 [Scortum barcoo]